MRIYTIKEAAKLLNLKPGTVYQYIRLGYIKASKIGNQWLIRQDNIKHKLA